MSAVQSSPSLKPRDLAWAGWRVLKGHIPMLSIEITRECPLSCPGCYAYGDSHLGGETTLRDLSDFRGTRSWMECSNSCGAIRPCMCHWWVASP